MNYKKLYDKIIEKRQKDPITEGYSELHHIVPKSLGGSDNPDNLVKLSAREHFICHYLLAKMYDKESFEWYKMNHAFMQMKANSVTKDRYFNSRLYEALRGNFSSVMSIIQSGNGNSQYGTCWICHIENKENKKIPKQDLELWLNKGWVKGRNSWKKKFSRIPVCDSLEKEIMETFSLKKRIRDELFLKMKRKLDCLKWVKQQECIKSRKQLIEKFNINEHDSTEIIKMTKVEIKEKRGGSREPICKKY